MAILGQTDEIDGEYWLLVLLENGQRGYLLRDVLEVTEDFDMVPTVIPPPRAS